MQVTVFTALQLNYETEKKKSTARSKYVPGLAVLRVRYNWVDLVELAYSP